MAFVIIFGNQLLSADTTLSSNNPFYFASKKSTKHYEYPTTASTPVAAILTNS
jgi:hypothetical protein